LPVVATLLGPAQIEVLSQRVEQGGPVVDSEMTGLAVDLQRDDTRRWVVSVFR
jgi:hypothetical protein